MQKCKNKRRKKTLFGVCLFLLGRVLIIKKLSHTHADSIRCWEAEYQSNCNSVVHSRVVDDENKRPRQRGSSATCFFFFSFSRLSLISSASWKTWRECLVKDVRKKKNQSGFHLDSIIYKETLLLVSGVYIIKRDVGGRCWSL